MHETEEQLVARYIGGLKEHIKETVNMFDPFSVSTAHQRALQLEKRRPSGYLQPTYGNKSSGGNNKIGRAHV